MTEIGVEQPKFVTLLGTRIAKEGFRFIFEGKTPVCSSCRLSSACLSNLESGKAYEVVEVKKVQHGCQLHNDGAVTVYVVPVHLEINVNSGIAAEGTTIAYKSMECPRVQCENFKQCSPTFLIPGDKLRIVKKNKTFPCPKDGGELTHVKIYKV
ncbi:MAG: UPF0179 family protein [Candidatus Hodarchaeales archaeon]